MLDVGIDQHAKQITVVVRNAEGEDVLKRQVSTRPEKIKPFFDQLAAMDPEFMAMLECCGFNGGHPESRKRVRGRVAQNRFPIGEPSRIRVIGRPTLDWNSVFGSMPMFAKNDAAKSSGV